MPTFRVTYRPGGRRLLEDVDAESYAHEAGRWHVLRDIVFVLGRPRTTVVRRIPVDEATGQPFCVAKVTRPSA